MGKILVIDDELAKDSKHNVRTEIEKLGKEINFATEFIEAPEEIIDGEEIIKKYNPSAIFLDIVHENRPYSIAKLIRESIGSKIPILVLSNYSKNDLKNLNKDINQKIKNLEKDIKQLKPFYDFFKEKTIDSTIKRDERGRLNLIMNFLDELFSNLKKYKEGVAKKQNIIKKIEHAPDIVMEVKDLAKNLKALKTVLRSSGMPDYLGGYPTDFRQVIEYVLKNNFVSMKNKIKNGIFAFKSASDVVLEVDGKNIIVKDNDGNILGSTKKLKHSNILKRFKNKKDNLTLNKSEEKARKTASEINNEIYDKTDCRVRSILSNTGQGKYSLDVKKLIVDGETLWSTDDLSATDNQFQKFANDIDTKFEKILGEIQSLKKRVQKLESN